MERKYQARIKKKVLRRVLKLPRNVQRAFKSLVLDLEEFGPIQRGWSNFSDLGRDKYHCHLMGSYVACWTYQKDTLIIEVYYAGSREDAPY